MMALIEYGFRSTLEVVGSGFEAGRVRAALMHWAHDQVGATGFLGRASQLRVVHHQVHVGPEMKNNSSRWFLSRMVFPVLLATLVLTSAVCAQDKIDMYGGYSYLRGLIVESQFLGPVALGNVSQPANLNGWEFSARYKLLPFVGAVADFAGNYGTLNNASTHVHSFLFGPEVSLPSKVSPFAHALFGVAEESQGPLGVPPCPLNPSTCSYYGSLGSGTSFATALGGGIDVKVLPFLKVRLIQMDYLRTQLHSTTQNQPRVSTGVVFHF
jgi:hypothetical protein